MKPPEILHITFLPILACSLLAMTGCATRILKHDSFQEIYCTSNSDFTEVYIYYKYPGMYVGGFAESCYPEEGKQVTAFTFYGTKDTPENRMKYPVPQIAEIRDGYWLFTYDRGDGLKNSPFKIYVRESSSFDIPPYPQTELVEIDYRGIEEMSNKSMEEQPIQPPRD